MTDDLVKRLNEDFSVNAMEDIQHQMKVYETERKEAADRIEQLEAALEKKNAHLYKLILVHKGEIPDMEIHGIPVMCDGERIFPRLADDVVLYAARIAIGENKND